MAAGAGRLRTPRTVAWTPERDDMQLQTLSEKLLFSTVRVDAENDAGVVESSTGFVFVYQVADRYVPVIVSCRHAVKDHPRGRIVFTIKENGKPKLGHGFLLNIEDFSNAWFFHPDPSVDIAIIPLTPLERHLRTLGVEVFYTMVSTDIVPSPAQVAQFDGFEDLVFVGYPNGIWDKKNLLPLMRRGMTATPLGVDFDGEPKFLMDASVFPGSSGSPVFLCTSGMRASNATASGASVLFVGMVAEVLFRHNVTTTSTPNELERSPALSREMLDLGVVYKAEAIVDTIVRFARSKGFVA